MTDRTATTTDNVIWEAGASILQFRGLYHICAVSPGWNTNLTGKIRTFRLDALPRISQAAPMITLMYEVDENVQLSSRW